MVVGCCVRGTTEEEEEDDAGVAGDITAVLEVTELLRPLSTPASETKSFLGIR